MRFSLFQRIAYSARQRSTQGWIKHLFYNLFLGSFYFVSSGVFNKAREHLFIFKKVIPLGKRNKFGERGRKLKTYSILADLPCKRRLTVQLRHTLFKLRLVRIFIVENKLTVEGWDCDNHLLQFIPPFRALLNIGPGYTGGNPNGTAINPNEPKYTGMILVWNATGRNWRLHSRLVQVARIFLERKEICVFVCSAQ